MYHLLCCSSIKFSENIQVTVQSDFPIRIQYLIMWVKIVYGYIIYKLFRRFLYDDHDGLLQVETTNSNAFFSVTERLEKRYGGKAYVGLRIPDAESGSRRDIDMVLVNKGEAVVISIQKQSGIALGDAGGNWVSTAHKTKLQPDPVAETKQQVAILESYLEQRGVPLPEGYLSCKVVKFQVISSNSFPPEFVSYDQWVQLKPEAKTTLSGWIKGTFLSRSKEMEKSIHQKLNFTLRTAPMWDRLELKGNKYLLGDFLEFKGNDEDTMLLKNIKRSKVSRLMIQMTTSMFGLAPSRLQVVYLFRDYRNERASTSDWKEITVKSSAAFLFQPKDSKKVHKIKLSSILSIHLSA
ncbi:uncharacterized protein LOC124936923 [Impatiens glandulifera]|uniref:uncharacterized protein LOC124936923 n=1 Tax=Impatiens glandulifera TaxID=253017 RepID=UPI001FB1553E|nr:uncharacterized protein LOC124936923 [Impatiens glandulifera]